MGCADSSVRDDAPSRLGKRPRRTPNTHAAITSHPRCRSTGPRPPEADDRRGLFPRFAHSTRNPSRPG